MSFHKKLQKILNKEKPKSIRLTCVNFWCKAKFDVLEDLYNEDNHTYGQCKKCRSFSKDMSGGVTNNGTKQYEGYRYDQDVFDKYQEGDVLFNEYKNKGN